ncbi:MAG: ABC transporter ATP-binding protein [Erysipelothrix sp.]|nr:ABC transporter ATP-binding protein [Erysipelothrix sp.]
MKMSQRTKHSPTDGRKLDMKTLKRLLNYVFSKYKKLYIVVLIGIIISSMASVASSLFLQTLIDDYIQPLIGTNNKDFTPLLQALSIMAVIYLVGVIANFIYQKMLVIISQGTMESMRTDLFSHMQSLPIGYFDSHAHGDIMSLYTNDIDTFRQVISQSIPQFFVSFITIVAVLISMLVLNIPLTLVTLLMVGVMQLVLVNIMGKSGKYFTVQQEMLGVENGYIEEMMEGARVVKVFNYEDKAIERFEKINHDLFESSYNANKFANILNPIIANLGHISYVLVATIGAILSINGWSAITIGGLASFLTLNRSFMGPINQISQQLNSVIMAMAGSKRIFALLDEESEVDQGHVTLVNAQELEDGNLIETTEETNTWAWKHQDVDGNVRYVKLIGDVRFYDVTFAYEEGKPVLHNINLYAEPGEKIAFVGATGAGKTTITNLINRFYDINEGSITYDGIDVKLIKKDDLRRSLGIVLQDTNLFTGTIEENIKYARPEATREEVIAASKLANAHSFIKHLEFGYDTILTHGGSSLSQGQRQLLSIARAALSNSPVLILDEATSSIDSQTERLVQEGMDKLMHGRTTFVIAHRLSTIKNSNVIMVLDQGRNIERGNHESLRAKSGTYYQLYTGVIEND